MNDALIKPVDIVIPIYRGLEETISCVEAAKGSLHQKNVSLILVDDCSPEEKISLFCLEQSKEEGIRLISNRENLGFVASVNKAMRSGVSDVVLLNSDTFVCNDWLVRLQAAAYSQADIATVTPLSNNATICTVPSIESCYKDGPLSIAEVDDLAASVNSNVKVEVPTAVGFCMYITRSALDTVGFFDEENFGKGYGEENDFCMRCTQFGLKHFMAQNIFVHHEGEVSFASESTLRKVKAEAVLLELHPEYPQKLENYLVKNEAQLFQGRLLAEVQWQSLYRNLSANKVVLHILGMDGGGSYRYVESLVEETKADVNHFSLIIDEQYCYLQDLGTAAFYNLSGYALNGELQDLLFRQLAIQNVHLHRFNAESIELFSIVDFSTLSLFITYHDVTFVKQDIFEDVGTTNFHEIHQHLDLKWVEDCKVIREAASASYFPSKYLKEVFEKIFENVQSCYVLCPDPQLSPSLIEKADRTKIVNSIKSVFDTTKKTIAVVGALGKHKGFDYFELLRDITTKGNSQLNWVLIGYTDKTTGFFSEKNYIVTGAYEASSLPDLLFQYDVDLVYFPPGVPESYCYALSDVFRSNCPVVVHNLGALAERVSSVFGMRHVLDAGLSVQQTADYLLNFTPEKCAVTTPENIPSSVGLYTKELMMNMSGPVNNEEFHVLQQSLQYFSIDQQPYRAELKRLSEVEFYLNKQLENVRSELRSLGEISVEREKWAKELETKNQHWQKKLERDIGEQAKEINELTSVKNGLYSKGQEQSQEIESLKEELHRARFSLSELLKNLKAYLIKRVKERLKL